MKEKYDRVLMIAASVIAILVSGFVAFKSFGFPEKFTQTPGSGSYDPPAGYKEVVTDAVTRLSEKKAWAQPTKDGQPGKTLRLLRSVALVQKAGEAQIIDLDAEPNGQLRPPIENRFLRKYDLEFERSDVAELDPDGDGFSNAEEFLWGETDPTDPKDFPPYWRKLELLTVKFSPYTLEFREKDGQTFVLRRVREDWRDKTIYADLSEPFRPARKFDTKEESDEARFTITEWNEESKEITLLDSLNEDDPQTYKLKEGDTLNIPYKLTTLEYTFPGQEKTFTDIREGKKIDLPNDDIEYKIVEVNEQNFIRISFTPKGEQNPKTVRIPEN
ncbi:MAG: Amuc_1099 family pilus-like system protein [Verrucomicrobiota bacterium]